MPKRRGRQTGSVLPHGKKGQYRAAYCLTRDGKRVRGSKVCPTKGEAELWLRKQLEKGPSAAGTVGEWLTEWLGLVKPDFAPKTYEHDAWRVGKYLLPRLGTVRLRDLDGVKVRRMLADMAADGRSDSERQKAGAVLRKALNAAVGLGRLANSPMTRVKLPTPKRPEKRVMDAGQLRAVVEAATAAGVGPQIQLWADAGFRPQEIFPLLWDDLDLDAGTAAVRRALDERTHAIKEPKTRRSRRTIALSAETVAALAAARPVDWAGKLVMPDSEGGMFWLSNFTRDVLKKAGKAAGVPWVYPYCFRHTMASILLSAGENVKVVSQRLGHEDITTTLRTYAHLMAGDDTRAAAVMGDVFGGRR